MRSAVLSFYFWKMCFFLLNAFYFLSSTVSGLLTAKKNPANINFNKEPVQYTENRHRTRRLWYPCRIQQTLFCFPVYHHFCIRIRTKRKKETSFMYLYNSATHKKAEFQTHTPGRVEMYTCGPTVYHFAHIGNLRSYIMEDVLEKALR